MTAAPSLYRTTASTALAWVARAVAGTRVEFASEAAADGMRGPGPRVFFCNHTSNLDGLIVWASLRPSQRTVTRPVAARDYWEASRIRHHVAVRIFRSVLVDRKRAEYAPAPDPSQPHPISASVQQMIDVLRGGESLIIFPEGMRNDGTQLGRFRSGIYQLAQACPEARLIPVRLQNLNRVLPKGEVIPVPCLGRMIVGVPRQLEPGEERRAFLDRMWTAVDELEA